MNFFMKKPSTAELILAELRKQTVLLSRIAEAVAPGPAVAAKILIGGKVATQPFVLQDIQEVPYQINAVDADGNPTTNIPAGATAAVTSSDPTIASVVPDATPAAGSIASGVIVGQSKLGSVTITEQVSDASGNALFPASTAVVQVVASNATGAAIAFGAPVNQPSAAAPASNAVKGAASGASIVK